MNWRLVIVCFLLVAVGVKWVAGADLPELMYLNTSVDPCVDFHRFACGNFKNVHSWPENEPLWDHFTILQKEIYDLSKDILSARRSENEPLAVQKAKAFYQSCLDVDYAAKVNSSQLKLVESFEWPVISDTYREDWDEKHTWNKLAVLMRDHGVQFFFEFSTTSSFFNSTAYAIVITIDSMSFPDAGVATPSTSGEQSQHNVLDHPEAYLTFLQKAAYRMRDLTHSYKSNEQIDRELEETLRFLRRVNSNGIPPTNITVDPIGTLEVPLRTIQAWTDKHFPHLHIDWVRFFNTLIIDADGRVNENTLIIQPDLYGLLNLYDRASPRALRNYIMARLMTQTAPVGDAVVRQAWIDFRKETDRAFNRDDYCVREALNRGSQDFSMAVTYEYQNYHFNNGKLKKVKTMHDDVRDAFVEIINETTWMDDETRSKAREKVRAMVTLLAYPEEILDVQYLNSLYEDLRVCTWDNGGNFQRLQRQGHNVNLRNIVEKRRRDLWNLSPLIVNAFYSRHLNRMALPVSILNRIFIDDIYNVLDYSRLGQIIGHEITHGFDNEGRQYGPEGLLFKNWWTNATQTAFKEKTQCFIDQYSKYFIEEIGEYIDATKTLNENLADNGGLRAAYKAFRKLFVREDGQTRTREPYSAEQLFFIGYGTMWCSMQTPQYLQGIHEMASSYAPNQYRIIGTVSNMREFADAFNCPKGSPMNPDNKCVLW